MNLLKNFDSFNFYIKCKILFILYVNISCINLSIYCKKLLYNILYIKEIGKLIHK